MCEGERERERETYRDRKAASVREIALSWLESTQDRAWEIERERQSMQEGDRERDRERGCRTEREEQGICTYLRCSEAQPAEQGSISVSHTHLKLQLTLGLCPPSFHQLPLP